MSLTDYSQRQHLAARHGILLAALLLLLSLVWGVPASKACVTLSLDADIEIGIEVVADGAGDDPAHLQAAPPWVSVRADAVGYVPSKAEVVAAAPLRQNRTRAPPVSC